MTKIIEKPLPNSISFSEVSDATVKQKMLLMEENVRALKTQLSEAQKAIVELQRR